MASGEDDASRPPQRPTSRIRHSLEPRKKSRVLDVNSPVPSDTSDVQTTFPAAPPPPPVPMRRIVHNIQTKTRKAKSFAPPRDSGSVPRIRHNVHTGRKTVKLTNNAANIPTVSAGSPQLVPTTKRRKITRFEDGVSLTRVSYHTVMAVVPANTNPAEQAPVQPSVPTPRPTAQPPVPIPDHHSIAPEPPVTTHADRQVNLTDNWDDIWTELLHGHYEKKVPLQSICITCKKEDPYIIHCGDCGHNAYYCKDHFMANHTHINQFHLPMQSLGHGYVPFNWKKDLIPFHPGCCTARLSLTTIIIDAIGRQHVTLVHYCSCISKAKQLLLAGFWPGTPVTPATAVDLRFMSRARSFMLEGCVALRNFCDSVLHDISSSPNYGSKVDLYRVLVNHSAAKHRHFMYQVAHLQQCLHSYPDGSQCPICEQTQDTLPKIVSLDGNFRLVRKKSAGKSTAPPQHGSRLFLERADLTRFFDNTAAATPENAQCNDFRAGDSHQSARHNANLEISGVFGSVCIHDYPCHFVDMDAGEKYGYAAAIIDKCLQDGRHLNVSYDIACKLKPSLQRLGIDLDSLTLSVPIFHGYAHDAKCQVTYNPRFLPDFRNSDGENIERLWSYLGKFTYITKEMTASNRRDLLVNALLHYGEKNIRNAGSRMKSRLNNAMTVHFESTVNLDRAETCLRDAGHIVTQEKIDSWCADFLTHVNTPFVRLNTDATWDEKYALTLNSYMSLTPHIVLPPVRPQEVELKTKHDKLDEQLNKVERTHRMQRWTATDECYVDTLARATARLSANYIKSLHQQAVERRHLLVLKRGARGTDTATRLSTAINSTVIRMKKLLGEYNAIHGVQRLTFDSVKDADARIYVEMDVGQRWDIPYHILKEIVTATNRIKRCDEEIEALKVEFPSLLMHYQNLHQLLHHAACNDDLYTLGEQAAFVELLLANECEQAALNKFMFGFAALAPLRIPPDTAYTDRMVQLTGALQEVYAYAVADEVENNVEDANADTNADANEDTDRVAELIGGLQETYVHAVRYEVEHDVANEDGAEAHEDEEEQEPLDIPIPYLEEDSFV